MVQFQKDLLGHVFGLGLISQQAIENTINTAIGSGVEESILKKFKNYIMKETLSKSLGEVFEKDMFVKELKVNDKMVKIGIKVVGSIMK